MDALRAALRTNPLVFDALLALALAMLAVVTILAGARDIGSYDPLSLALLFLQSLPLVLRRVFPIPIFLVTLAATLGHAWLAADSLSSGIGALIALFTVSESHPRRRSIPAAVLAGGSLALLIAVRGGIPASLGSLVQTVIAALAAWTLGAWARERRAYIGSVESRAELAERTRDAEARRAVTEERERIARELHDVVTHHVSVMVIQAGAAERALERHPDEARTAIGAVAATGRQALADMRRMLGVLGPGSIGATSGTDVPEPMPSLDRLGELLESVHAAGLPVELTVSGERRRLHPGVELSAYRIIQEALTNTLKHTSGARARVTVRYGATTLEVSVSDDGGAGHDNLAEAESGGRGLIGMRERVTLFGGSLDARPVGSGFLVDATLPLDAVPS